MWPYATYNLPRTRKLVVKQTAKKDAILAAFRIKKNGKDQATNWIFSEAFSIHDAIPFSNP